MVDVDRRDLRRIWHQEVHERRVEQLPVLVVGHLLVQRARHTLRDATGDLPLDDARVDQRPAVVDDGVTHDADVGRVRIDLDLHGMHPVREGRADRRVVVRALESRHLPVGDGRTVDRCR